MIKREKFRKEQVMGCMHMGIITIKFPGTMALPLLTAVFVIVTT